MTCENQDNLSSDEDITQVTCEKCGHINVVHIPLPENTTQGEYVNHAGCAQGFLMLSGMLFWAIFLIGLSICS